MSTSLSPLVRGLTTDQIIDLVDSLPPSVADALVGEMAGVGGPVPQSPLEQAQTIDPGYVARPHLRFISDRILDAVLDVEAGKSRRLIIEMPPRSGKTTMTTLFTPAWVLQRHPDWPIVLTSHDSNLATSWGRQIRRWIEDHRLNVNIAPDAGAVSEWETVEGGGVTSRSVRASLTGRGAKVLIVDDPHKDFVDAHSTLQRDRVWDWWLSVAQTRLEPPTLIVVVMTRWHQDDFVGRLLSPDTEGDPADWEVIRLPALADAPDDPLGRTEGHPLLSPLVKETPLKALQRWADVSRAVGSYVWSAMYQQRPAPAQGAIFDRSWWRYWTTDPSLASDTVLLVSDTELRAGRWLDSWDTSFKGTDTSDYCVGQRWVKIGEHRLLVAQQRARVNFTSALGMIKGWTGGLGPWGELVHERLIESSANGPAIMDSLRDKVPGIKAIKATTSKESRGRAVTPEIETGFVFLPHPAQAPWVMKDLLPELSDFPHGAHDDQVDAMTQALAEFRSVGRARITVPRGHIQRRR